MGEAQDMPLAAGAPQAAAGATSGKPPHSVPAAPLARGGRAHDARNREKRRSADVIARFVALVAVLALLVAAGVQVWVFVRCFSDRLEFIPRENDM